MDGLQDDQDTHELLGVLDELRRICSSRAEAVSLRTFDVWRKRWKEKQRLTQHRRAAQAHGTELALKNFTQSVLEWDRDRHVLDAGFDATIQCVCMIFMLLYVQVMSTIVQPMDCTLQDDGRWYRRYPKVVCYDYTIEAGWFFDLPSVGHVFPLRPWVPLLLALASAGRTLRTSARSGSSQINANGAMVGCVVRRRVRASRTLVTSPSLCRSPGVHAL